MKNYIFTEQDKMKARKYRETGYEWAFRDISDCLFICKLKPLKVDKTWLYIMERNGDIIAKRIDKRNFKPVQSSDSEPTKLDDIVGK